MSQPFDNRDYDVQQLAEKDAEIVRLKEAFDTVSDQLCDRENKIRQLEKLNQMTDEESILELKAQIEKLKEENAHFAWRDADKNKLITELCDALEVAHPDNPTPSLPDTLKWLEKYPDLIQRAREAAR